MVQFIIQHTACSILDDEIGQLLGYQSTDLLYVSTVIVHSGRPIFILVIHFLLLYNIYFHSLDAEK